MAAGMAVFVVFAAAVASAGVIAVVMVAVVAALNVGVEQQLSCEIGFYRRVGFAAYAAEEADASHGKRHLCAAADAAAD